MYRSQERGAGIGRAMLEITFSALTPNLPFKLNQGGRQHAPDSGTRVNWPAYDASYVSVAA